MISEDTKNRLFPPVLGLNKLQCVLSVLTAYSLVTQIQPAFCHYIRLLPNYISAMVTNSRVKANDSFHPINWLITDCFPYEYPNLSVAFRSPPPNDIMDKLKAFGFEEQMIKGRKVYLFRDPTQELVHIIMSIDHDTVAPSPNSFVNSNCLRYIALIRKIFSAFFNLHSYPAFQSPEHATDISNLRLIGVGKGKKRGAPAGGPISKRTRTGEQSTTMETDEVDEDQTEMELPPPTLGEISWCMPNKRSPIPWGTFTQLPSSHGVFVPFIVELLAFDKRIILDVLMEYFIGCLGSNTEEVRAMVEKLKAALGVICYTSIGKVLAHMSLCIRLGLQAQSRIYPVFEGGVYEGCVLVGSLFSVVVEGNVYGSLPPERLESQVLLFSTTISSLRAIGTIAGDPELLLAIDGSPNFSSFMEMKRVLSDRALTNEQRDEVVKLAIHLRRSSWALNPSTITKALGYLTIPLWKELPGDLPVHPTMLFEDDVLAVVWSCFGDMAPSPRFQSGQVVDLRKSSTPAHIGFSQRVLSQAISDMRNIYTSKTLTIPTLNRRSSVHKDRIFQGNVAGTIFGLFRGWVGSTAAATGEGSTIPVVSSSTRILEDF